ncbi:MAG TPA: complex I NDUFA9 subunit family protein [Syntrophaceae bacterium]|nr:complex I NDUFA9 subunit family protein [Syntrophaceae bacterium]
MKVFLTGGTGFVGSHIIEELLNQGHNVRCLVRIGSEKRLLHTQAIEIVNGDVLESEGLAQKMKGCDAVIHLVGIIREFPKRGITFEGLHFQATVNVVDETIKSGIKRYLHMSALGTRPHAKALYHQTKYQAEEYVQKSKLIWTIFRPSLIFGLRDNFVNMLAHLIRSSPIFPVVGDGLYQLQPVSVETVAAAFVKALEMEETHYQIYELAGDSQTNRLTYNDLVDTIAQVIGKKAWKVHIPVWLMYTLAHLFGGFKSFPITHTQITMLLEGNICDEKPFYKVFGLEPKPFKEGIARYVRPV